MPEDFVRVRGGIDRGALSGVTAIKAIGKMPSGRLYSFFEWSQHQATLSDVGCVCVGIQERYPGIIWDMDPHPQGEREIATLYANGIRVQRAAKKDMLDVGVRRMWDYLRVRADGLPGYFISPACPQTIAEYQSWSFCGSQPAGEISYQDVEKHGKDHLDAERYCLVGLTSGQDPDAEPQEVSWTVHGKPVRV
jgi:hypothetical protein